MKSERVSSGMRRKMRWDLTLHFVTKEETPPYNKWECDEWTFKNWKEDERKFGKIK